MENKLMTLVKQMHQKFNLENNTGPQFLDNEEKQFRIKALREEIDEYESSDDLVDEFDALIDLLVFTVGTFERHGFPMEKGFEIVMRKNMQKELGQNGNKRGGFKRDLVKPTNWVGPEQELAQLLSEYTLGESSVNQDWDYEFNPTFEATQKLTTANQSLKYDEGKPRLDLLPYEPLIRISEVLNFGAIKYGPDNWRMENVPMFSRLYASILRHLMAWNSGQDNDPESGLSHLAHASTQLMFLIYHTIHNPSRDNRFWKVK